MDSFTTEAFTLLAIALLFIGIRTYARLSAVGFAGLKADDYLMLLAAVVYSGETALAYSVGAYWQGKANNAMTDAERMALDPSSEEFRIRVNGSKTQVAGWSTYTFLLWILKASMCTFYLRLTDGLNYHMRIYVGFVLIFTTWVAVLLSILLGCRPMSKNWQIYPDPGLSCQPAISRIDIFVTVVLNVLTDMYLMSIPLPMLWQTSMPPIKKIGLTILFSGGIFVTMAGILRCVLIITNPVTGAQQAGSWACRETFVAVITSNLPMIFPLVRRWGILGLDSIRSSGGRSGRGSGDKSASGGFRGPAFVLEDKNPRRGMGPRSVHPITNITFNESEERIYSQDQQQQQQQQELPPKPLDAPDQTIPWQPLGQQNSASGGARHFGLDLESGGGGGDSDNHRHHPQKSQGSSSGKTSLGYITKEVELHITEEERRRRSEDGSDVSADEVVEGANKGNYFLTQNRPGRPSAINRQDTSGSLGSDTGVVPSGGGGVDSGSPSNSIAPLASTSWFHGHNHSPCRSSDRGKVVKEQRSSFGLKSGRRH